MSFLTSSAILRGAWLIDKQYADGFLPLVAAMLRGENPNFSHSIDKPEYKIYETEEERRLALGPKPFEPVVTAVNYSSVTPRTDLAYLDDNSVAVVSITGPILKHGDSCIYGSIEYTGLINRLAANNKVAGIILKIDSGGGQASGTTMLVDAIKACTQQKPVYGVVDDGLAASAAYWIISACTKVFATKSTDYFGSAGAYQTIQDWHSYFTNYLKMPSKDVYSNLSTEKNIEWRTAIEGDDKQLKESLDTLVEPFHASIIDSRGDKLTDEGWKTGRLYLAQEAKTVGLIDDVQPWANIINDLEAAMQPAIPATRVKNSRNMSYKHLQAASQAADGFTETESGVLVMTPEQMQAADDHIANLEAQVQSLTEEKATAATNLESLTTELNTANAKIKSFEEAPSGDGTVVGATEDPKAEKKNVPLHLDDNHPVNRAFDQTMAQAKRRERLGN